MYRAFLLPVLTLVLATMAGCQQPSKPANVPGERKAATALTTWQVRILGRLFWDSTNNRNEWHCYDPPLSWTPNTSKVTYDTLLIDFAPSASADAGIVFASPTVRLGGQTTTEIGLTNQRSGGTAAVYLSSAASGWVYADGSGPAVETQWVSAASVGIDPSAKATLTTKGIIIVEVETSWLGDIHRVYCISGANCGFTVDNNPYSVSPGFYRSITRDFWGKLAVSEPLNDRSSFVSTVQNHINGLHCP